MGQTIPDISPISVYMSTLGDIEVALFRNGSGSYVSEHYQVLSIKATK